MKTEDLIKLQKSIANGNWDVDTHDEIDPVYQMSLGQEWKAVGIRDPDGIESVVAMCHPNNARAIALVPQLLSEVVTLRNALKGLLAIEDVRFWLPNNGLADGVELTDLTAARAALSNNE